MQAETTNPDAQRQAENESLQRVLACAQTEIEKLPEGSQPRAFLAGFEDWVAEYLESRGVGPKRSE